MPDSIESGTRGRYNILFLTTDQTYAHAPRPEGYELPNRQRLEDSGLVFDNFQVNTALCTPSRSVMWTGIHAVQNEMWDNTNMAWIDDLDPEKVRTVGHMLRDAGYYTAFKGKWHLSVITGEHTRDALEPYGFSDYQDFGEIWGENGDGYKRDGEIATDSAAWLTGRAGQIAKDQPWFLSVNFCNPHDIMFFDADGTGDTQVSGLVQISPEPDDPIYQKQWDVELPSSFDDPLDQHPEAIRYYRRLCDISYGEMPTDRHDMWKRYVNYYLNCLRDVDRHIGTVLEALEASGQADRTIIVYSADHGDMVAGHGMRQKGAIPFKEGWNVPFVVVHPDHDGARTTDAVGTSVDIAPTLLRWAGVTPEVQSQRDPQLRGFDVAGVVADPATFTARGSTAHPGTGALYTYDVLWAVDMEFIAEAASGMIDLGDDEDATEEEQSRLDKAKGLVKSIRDSHFDARHVLRGVYDGRYKFIRYHAINEHNQPATIVDLYRDNDVALYDLWEDPDEMDNLANHSNPKFDEALVDSMNDKLNDLIREELGDDPDIVQRPLLFMGVAGFKQRIKG
jgi:arylsulfatase A-like enzyme